MEEKEGLCLVGKEGSVQEPAIVAPPHARGLSWLGRHELGFILALVLLTVTTWGVFELVDLVIYEKQSQAMDEKILLALRNPLDRTDPIGPRWMEEMGRDLTALGGFAMQILLVVAVGGYLALRRAYRALGLLVVAMGGGILLSSFFKSLFSRPRPSLVPHGSIVYTTSFPSGHSMMSTVTWLTLAVLLARMEPRKSTKAFLLSLAVLLSFLVGVSRVYLGVHWPTDVLAGWSMGLIWALLCWLVMRALQRKGNVEVPREEAAELKATGPHL